MSKLTNFCTKSVLIIVITGFFSVDAFADWRDWKNKIFKSGKSHRHSTSREPDSSYVARGLKQALQKGTLYAVQQLGQYNGFYGHSHLRIPVPRNLRRLTKILKRLGLKKYIRRFQKTMNRSAELAVKEAGPIFYRAIRRMTLRDAMRILRGPDDAATRYFQHQTSEELARLFRPIVRRAMSKTGVEIAYRKMKKYGRYDRFGYFKRFNLEDYIVEKAISGLFVVIAEQERAIRRNPAKRTTRLLRRVFGFRH